MIVTLTDAELEQADRDAIAGDRLNLRVPTMNALATDRLADICRLGQRGEWVVAKALGLAPPQPRNTPDNGNDLELPRAGSVRRYRIAGGIRSDQFYDTARLGDFGHGPTHYVEQDELEPWPEVALELLKPRTPKGTPCRSAR